MINCKHCGTQLSEFVNFCNVCGKPVVSFDVNTQSTGFKQQNSPGFNKVSVTVPNIKKALSWIIAGILFLVKLFLIENMERSVSDPYQMSLVLDGFIFLFLFISLGRAFSEINGKSFSIDKITNKLSITAIIFYILGVGMFIFGIVVGDFNHKIYDEEYVSHGISVYYINIFLDGLAFSVLFIGFGKFFTKIKNHIGSQQTKDSKTDKTWF
jgi:hypothetical protein